MPNCKPVDDGQFLNEMVKAPASRVNTRSRPREAVDLIDVYAQAAGLGRGFADPVPRERRRANRALMGL